MATTIDFTQGQTVLVSGNTAQAVYDALDVLNADALDLELGVVQYTGFSTVTFTLETAMQNEYDDGSWQTVATFTAVTTAPTHQLKSLDKGFLRYLRWRVAVTGSGSLHFWLRGVARSYA